MRQVAILGIGQIKIDEHWELSLREIGGNAAFAALQDAGMNQVDALFVGNMLSPMVNGQNQLGTFFADWIGLWKQEAVKVEAACASGAAALRAGLMAVSAGEVESAFKMWVMIVAPEPPIFCAIPILAPSTWVPLHSPRNC